MAGLGIYDYGARFYSPKLGRFLSADTIVPGAANPQALNRYSYVLGNPIRYNDPTGHMCSDPDDHWGNGCDGSGTPPPTTPLPTTPLPNPGSGDNDDNADLEDELSLYNSTGNSNSVTSSIVTPEEKIVLGPNPEALIKFWEYFGAPIFFGLEMDEVYQASQRGGWKLVKWSIPSGPFEAVVGGLRQGYHDSWDKGLNPYQRGFRIGIAGGEAFLVDGASTLAGATAFEVAGPIGYLAGAIVVSTQGEKFFHDTVNPRAFPALGLGIDLH